VARKIINFFS